MEALILCRTLQYLSIGLLAPHRSTNKKENMNWNEYLVAQQKKKKKNCVSHGWYEKGFKQQHQQQTETRPNWKFAENKTKQKIEKCKKNPTFWAQMKNANEANGDANGNRIFSGSDSSLFFLWGEGIPGHVIQGWEFMGVGCGVYGISLFGVGSKK